MIIRTDMRIEPLLTFDVVSRVEDNKCVLVQATVTSASSQEMHGEVSTYTTTCDLRDARTSFSKFRSVSVKSIRVECTGCIQTLKEIVPPM